MTERGKNFTSESKEEKLIITRVFDASRERIWKAWTEPEHFKRWWGPKNFTSPVCKTDLRVGGTYLWCMHGPDGKNYWSTGVYRTIVPLERIVYTDNFADENGNIVPASYYGMTGDWPTECTVTVTLEQIGKQSKMTLQHVGIPSGTMSEMAGLGWNQSFDKLAENLK